MPTDLRRQAGAPAGAAAPPALLAAGLVAAWGWGSGRGLIPAYLLPSPAAVVHALAANGATLLRHSLATTREALGGFALGAAAGLAAAIVLSLCAAFAEARFPSRSP